jgi:iron complex outermembrane receptor protein
VYWNPDRRLGLYANWSQGFMPPATEELAHNPEAMGGFNQRLVPATSEGEEIGLRGTLWGQLTYDLALFRLSTDNDFGRYRVASRPLETFYQNAGSSLRYGLETALAWSPIPALRVEVAYTLSSFRYLNIKSLFGDFSDKVMPNSPAHQVAANLQYVLGGHWVFGVGLDGVSSWYVDQANNLSANGYALVHLRLAYRWVGKGYRGELFAYARNLFGEKYIAFTEPDPDGNSFQPGPTREIFMGARFAFGE